MFFFVVVVVCFVARGRTWRLCVCFVRRTRARRTINTSTQDELDWCHPWPKFLSIKGVVFLTFWQGIAISLLLRVGFKLESAETAATFQNILITVEMFVAALFQTAAFSHREWDPAFQVRSQVPSSRG